MYVCMYVCMKALFSSKKVNGKENQAVYHMLLKVLFSLYSFIIEIYILPPPPPTQTSPLGLQGPLSYCKFLTTFLGMGEELSCGM